MVDSVSGGGLSGVSPVPKGRRFAAGLIDLFIIPIVLGILIGLALFSVSEGIRSVILVLVNIGWLVFRDMVYSPGRAMVGIKLVSLTGSKVTVTQALIRNILLIIPFILIVGYVIEIIMIATKGNRLADSWAKTQVVQA